MSDHPSASRGDARPAWLSGDSAGGIALMLATLLAMLVANSPLGTAYQDLLEWRLALGIGPATLAKPVLLWINDGLMAVFFLMVGLELRREVIHGQLSSLRKASLPGWAALGGMLLPALIYLAMNSHDPSARAGWAIPTATDIAFALGVLALAGPRIPAGLKAFLLSVAVFDDLGAVVVIALFYTAKLSWPALLAALVVLAALAGLKLARVRSLAPYLLLGALLWVAVLKSGVHATLAGVVLALFIPAGKPDENTPASRLEHGLHPWVAFGILPVFAFANAGLDLRGTTVAQLIHPVPLGVLAGLLLGKPLGVLLFAWLPVRAGWAALPEGVDWRMLSGVALLCGIGFTMSLFIASLAFEQGPAAGFGLERLGILAGSLVAGALGLWRVRRALR